MPTPEELRAERNKRNAERDRQQWWLDNTKWFAAAALLIAVVIMFAVWGFPR